MKTVYVVHCCNAVDSVWSDRDKADARAKKVSMIVLPCPMPDDGDTLPPAPEPAWQGRPLGFKG